MTDPLNVQDSLKKRFAQLPKVVQNAITSADVKRRLRELAETNKLHIDQWDKLENEVMMTLFGVTPTDALQANIKKHVGVSDEMATTLAAEVSKIVFEPIRQELERSLDNPQAKTGVVSDVEKVGQQILAQEKVPAAPAVVPATPPAPAPEGKVVRAPVSEAYKAGEPSTVRKSVHDDPYREPPA